MAVLEAINVRCYAHFVPGVCYPVFSLKKLLHFSYISLWFLVFFLSVGMTSRIYRAPPYLGHLQIVESLGRPRNYFSSCLAIVILGVVPHLAPTLGCIFLMKAEPPPAIPSSLSFWADCWILRMMARRLCPLFFTHCCCCLPAAPCHPLLPLSCDQIPLLLWPTHHCWATSRGQCGCGGGGSSKHLAGMSAWWQQAACAQWHCHSRELAALRQLASSPYGWAGPDFNY